MQSGLCDGFYAIFQSTLPVWGGTDAVAVEVDVAAISIHPPRVGRDIGAISMIPVVTKFQSTLPVWGGTY